MNFQKDELEKLGIPCAYAGKKSEKFWKIINKLPKPHLRDAAYSLGVALQNVEHDLRRLIGLYIEEAQRKEKKQKRKKVKEKVGLKCATCKYGKNVVGPIRGYDWRQCRITGCMNCKKNKCGRWRER